MAKKSKSVHARLLVDTWIEGTLYRCDTLVFGSKTVIDALVKTGNADKSDESVAYKKLQNAEPVEICIASISSINADSDEVDNDDDGSSTSQNTNIVSESTSSTEVLS